MEHWKSWMTLQSDDTWETTNCRPPPLRTSHTYDDDDVFTNVALNLVSRYDALALTPEETIYATLTTPKDRSSFYEGLRQRINSASRLSPSILSLVQQVERKIGHELKAIIEDENSEISCRGISSLNRAGPPHTPRNEHGHMVDSSAQQYNHQHLEKKRQNKWFFPDSSRSKQHGGFFRSRRVQNINWKLTETIERVENLRLDGSTNNTHNASYEPPTL